MGAWRSCAWALGNGIADTGAAVPARDPKPGTGCPLGADGHLLAGSLHGVLCKASFGTMSMDPPRRATGRGTPGPMPPCCPRRRRQSCGSVSRRHASPISDTTVLAAAGRHGSRDACANPVASRRGRSRSCSGTSPRSRDPALVCLPLGYGALCGGGALWRLPETEVEEAEDDDDEDMALLLTPGGLGEARTRRHGVRPHRRGCGLSPPATWRTAQGEGGDDRGPREHARDPRAGPARRRRSLLHLDSRVVEEEEEEEDADGVLEAAHPPRPGRGA